MVLFSSSWRAVHQEQTWMPHTIRSWPLELIKCKCSRSVLHWLNPSRASLQTFSYHVKMNTDALHTFWRVCDITVHMMRTSAQPHSSTLNWVEKSWVQSACGYFTHTQTTEKKNNNSALDPTTKLITGDLVWSGGATDWINKQVCSNHICW